MSTVFVTGCSSGFGFHLARRLLADGHRVVATDPSLDGWVERLEAPGPARLLALPLDVRDADEVRTAIREALAWSPVDVLVNNAGYAVFGTIEEADLEAVRALFDVNVLGVARVTQALLPALRAARGTVVFLSSIAGRTVFPESGFYAGTKYAVEAMGEALHQETAAAGVRVRLIAPGSFATGFQARATAASRPRDPLGPYAALQPGWDARKMGVLCPGQDPRRVVDAIIASIADPAPFRRVPVGPDAVRILGLRDALGPDAWSRLAGVRAGGTPSGEPGDVVGPAEVLAAASAGGDGGELAEALAPTLAAYRFGHLEHWAIHDAGRRALAVLAAVGAGVSA